MRIALIAHGKLPIPPRAWGAVESTIWYRSAELRRLGHTVDIYNTRDIGETIETLNRESYDFIHCHNELFTHDLQRGLKHPYALSCHSGSLARLMRAWWPTRHRSFRESLRAPANLLLSEDYRELYLRNGYRGFLGVVRNMVECDAFRFLPRGNGKAICVGRIIPRKRQATVAKTTRGQVQIDFVGPWRLKDEPKFAENETAKYLGEWEKSVLHDRLTEYSCMVLLSETEAAARVVLEALAAGLSVVISDRCTANLTAEEFITVLPLAEKRPEVINAAIKSAIERNDSLREKIRAYARERFDYSVAVPEYLRVVRECQDFFASRRQ